MIVALSPSQHFPDFSNCVNARLPLPEDLIDGVIRHWQPSCLNSGTIKSTLKKSESSVLVQIWLKH